MAEEWEEWLERWVAKDAERVRSFLGKAVSTCGMTRQDLDRRLGWGPGYTSSVLTGRLELKHEHVAAILLTLGVHPGVFYDILYPKDRPVGPVEATVDFARMLAAAGLLPHEAPPALPAASSMSPADIKALVEETVQRALAAQQKVKHKSPHRKRKSSPAKRRDR